MPGAGGEIIGLVLGGAGVEIDSCPRYAMTVS